MKQLQKPMTPPRMPKPVPMTPKQVQPMRCPKCNR